MEVDPTVNVYGDWHRQFMQVLLTRPALYDDELNQVLDSICGEDAFRRDNTKRKTFLKTVQSKIEPLGLDLKEGILELAERPMYMLINKSAGEEMAVKKQTPQLRFLCAIVKRVITSNHGDISETDAVNLIDDVDGVSKADAEILLEKLVYSCWLEKKDGKVALHARCILELRPYLMEHYADYVSNCSLCNKITVCKWECERDGCDAKYHWHCLKKRCDRVAAATCEKCGAELPRGR